MTEYDDYPVDSEPDRRQLQRVPRRDLAQPTMSEASVQTSIDDSTPAGRRAVVACMAPAEMTSRTAVNLDLDVVQWLSYLGEFTDDDSGEVRQGVVCNLVLADGRTVNIGGSRLVYQTWRYIASKRGPGPFAPPVRIVIRSKPCTRAGAIPGSSYCYLEELEPDGAEDYHGTAPAPKKPKSPR
jgi:hypothetical protein